MASYPLGYSTLLFGGRAEVEAQSEAFLILKHGELIRQAKDPAHLSAHLPQLSVT